ncbi:hypothetical protein [Tatumella sp. UBA2305]|uniref:hypothetical protein n=1 Tax=Tatumella sp. UBA2305 TaxID=1947647 RepID=UPI0025DF9511|nr:hypothetical protein [Tatumella sp. UBA2305]
MFGNINPEEVINENFVIHCPKVKIIHKKSLLFSGYGTIRKNKLLTYYVELICLEDNYKFEYGEIEDFFIDLPKQPCDDVDKLYAEFTTTDGDILTSSDFIINISVIPLPHGTYRTIKFLVPYVLYEEEKLLEEKNSIQYRFLEKIKIPTNKINSITSTTGVNSSKKNESDIPLATFDVKIRSETDYTLVSANGDFEIEPTMEAINFYLAFSGGTLPQPYFLTYSTGNKKSIKLISINNQNVNKKSSDPIPESFAKRGKLTTDYSFNFLEKIITLKNEKPGTFDTLQTHWKRVWQSTQSSNDICKLVLSVAIEGLLNDVYIPEFKIKFINQKTIDDIAIIKKMISKLETEAYYKDRLKNSISYLNEMTSSKALDVLINENILTTSDKTIWTKMRNSAAHPKGNMEKQNDDHLDIRVCFDLFHKIILNIIGYEGPVVCFGSNKKNEITIIEYKKVI